MPIRILLAESRSRHEEVTSRHGQMKNLLAKKEVELCIKRTSGIYPIMRAPRIEDMLAPTELVEDPGAHPSTRQLTEGFGHRGYDGRELFAYDHTMALVDGLVIDLTRNDAQDGYWVAKATGLGIRVLVVREKSTAIQLPKLQCFEGDPHIMLAEYASIGELDPAFDRLIAAIRRDQARSAQDGPPTPSAGTKRPSGVQIKRPKAG